MTQPAQPPVDSGNHLLGETPATLTTALMQTAGGQRLALTIRTPSTTLTVLLGKADAVTWAGNVNSAAAQMSGAGLIVANGNVTPPNGGINQA